MTTIPHGAWIAVADGAKALVLRNDGEADIPNFTTLDVFENSRSVPTSQMGSDRPGRTHASAGTHRSSVGQTDWHELEELRFARRVGEALEKHCLAGDFKQLIVVAPARTLAELRKHFSPRLKDAIIAEIDKDLTGHPVYEMEKVLRSA
jgi:protein required for attachment to host cells